jgi:hypothetical protein
MVLFYILLPSATLSVSLLQSCRLTEGLFNKIEVLVTAPVSLFFALSEASGEHIYSTPWSSAYWPYTHSRLYITQNAIWAMSQ